VSRKRESEKEKDCERKREREREREKEKKGWDRNHSPLNTQHSSPIITHHAHHAHHAHHSSLITHHSSLITHHSPRRGPAGRWGNGNVYLFFFLFGNSFMFFLVGAQSILNVYRFCFIFLTIFHPLTVNDM
jgi:hypothetical protein